MYDELEKMTPEQLKTVKRYHIKLSELKGEETCEFLEDMDDEMLSILTGDLNIIDKLGGGDPEKAAHKHYETMTNIYKAIFLSGGDLVSDKLQ